MSSCLFGLSRYSLATSSVHTALKSCFSQFASMWRSFSLLKRNTIPSENSFRKSFPVLGDSTCRSARSGYEVLPGAVDLNAMKRNPITTMRESAWLTSGLTYLVFFSPLSVSVDLFKGLVSSKETFYLGPYKWYEYTENYYPEHDRNTDDQNFLSCNDHPVYLRLGLA